MTTMYVHPDPTCKPSRHRPNVPGASFMELQVFGCEYFYTSDITPDLTEDTVKASDQDHSFGPPSPWLSP